MSHQRYPSLDPGKEPHSISLKVLRLSRPSLVFQYPIPPPATSTTTYSPPIAASLAYSTSLDTNPEPFILSPILNLPLSFGSAYVGEAFSCTLCANHDIPEAPAVPGTQPKQKKIRDVRIEAEMKTPGPAAAVKRLELTPAVNSDAAGEDLESGQTMQRVVNFDLKEEGNHVLAVTVSYYEATDTSGRTRTFRKLYQFICKASLIVRTKAGPIAQRRDGQRQWVLEAQLENCSEDLIQLEKVGLELEDGLEYGDCNWETDAGTRPVLHPGEVEQVCFIVREEKAGIVLETPDGRVIFGILAIGWRGEMGNRGFLSTGKLGSRIHR